MPNYDEPLTRIEKEAIIKRHHYLVDKMNERLGGVLKYEDEEILKKLDDPKNAAIYRMNEEFKMRNIKRANIVKGLEAKYGTGNIDNNPVKRLYKFALRLSDDPKDVAYNEKIYQEAINNPAKFIYREYDKVLKFDPTSIANIGDDKVAQAEYYMEHQALCEEAFALQSVMNNGVSQATPAMKQALKSMKLPYEGLIVYGTDVKQGGMDYFACPTFESPEQAAMAMASPELFAGNPNPDLTLVMNNKVAPETVEGPEVFLEQMKNYGINTNDSDLFIKYKAVRTDLNTGKREEVSFDDLFVKDDPNVRIEKRSKEEMFQIRAINRTFLDKYVDTFQNRISSKLNQLVFDANQIADERKGNWVERNILHSTSPEWSAFIETFKQFNDPNHENYGRKDVLREKAEAYQQHKRDQGYENLSDMKGTSLKRSTLCQAVIDTCKVLEETDDSIKEDIDIEINTGLKGKVGMIINADEVDIFDDYKKSNDNDELNKSLDDLDDELSASSDDDLLI